MIRLIQLILLSLIVLSMPVRGVGVIDTAKQYAKMWKQLGVDVNGAIAGYNTIVNTLIKGMQMLGKKTYDNYILQFNIFNDLETNLARPTFKTVFGEVFVDVPEHISSKTQSVITLISSKHEEHSLSLTLPFEDTLNYIKIKLDHYSSGNERIVIRIETLDFSFSPVEIQLGKIRALGNNELPLYDNADIWVEWIYDPWLSENEPKKDFPLQISLRFFRKRRILTNKVPLFIHSLFTNIPIIAALEKNLIIQKEDLEGKFGSSNQWRFKHQLDDIYVIINEANGKLLTIDPLNKMKLILADQDQLTTINQWWKIEPELTYENIFSIKTFIDGRYITTDCYSGENNVTISMITDMFPNECNQFKIDSGFNSLADFGQYHILNPYTNPQQAIHAIYSTAQLIQYTPIDASLITLREVIISDLERYYILFHSRTGWALQAYNETTVKFDWPLKKSSIRTNPVWGQYWKIHDVFLNGTLYRILQNCLYSKSFLSHNNQKVSQAQLSLSNTDIFTTSPENPKLFIFSPMKKGRITLDTSQKFIITRSIGSSSYLGIATNKRAILQSDPNSFWNIIPVRIQELNGHTFIRYILQHSQTELCLGYASTGDQPTPLYSSVFNEHMKRGSPFNDFNHYWWDLQQDFDYHGLFYKIVLFHENWYLRTPTPSEGQNMQVTTESEVNGSHQYEYRFLIRAVSS